MAFCNKIDSCLAWNQVLRFFQTCFLLSLGTFKWNSVFSFCICTPYLITFILKYDFSLTPVFRILNFSWQCLLFIPIIILVLCMYILTSHVCLTTCYCLPMFFLRFEAMLVTDDDYSPNRNKLKKKICESRKNLIFGRVFFLKFSCCEK